jgi:hypothetical protein
VEGLRIPLKPEDVLPPDPSLMAYFAHAGIQCLFSGMAKRRMAKIVSQSSGFRKFRGETAAQLWLFDKQIVRNCAGDLRHFDTVGQPCAIKVRLPDTEDLRFPLQPAESRAVQNAVPVSFSSVPVIFGRSRAFLIPALEEEFIHFCRLPIRDSKFEMTKRLTPLFPSTSNFEL